MKVLKNICKGITIIVLLYVFMYNNNFHVDKINNDVQEKNAFIIQEEQQHINLNEAKINKENCEYEIKDNKAIIYDYTGNEDSIVIDEKIDGYKISGIDTNSFSNSSSIEMIKISKKLANVVGKIENFEKSSVLSNNEYIVYSTTKEYNEEYLNYVKLSNEEKSKLEVIPEKFITPIDTIYSDYMQSLYQDVADETLPQKYDLRNNITLNVKDQGSFGICYSSATITAAESTLQKTKKINKTFSDVHAAVVSEQGCGGNFDTIYNKCFGKRYGPIEVSKNTTYFDRATAENSSNAIAKKATAYCRDSDSITKDELNQVINEYKKYSPDYCTLRKISFASIDGEKKKDSKYKEDVENNRKLIKKHIYKYGSVYIHIIIDNWKTLYGVRQLCSDTKDINHAVSLVGWDDSKQAYIAQNSWGSDWESGGYFYISYNDYNVEKTTRGFVEVADKNTYLDINNANSEIKGSTYVYTGKEIMPSYENPVYDGTSCVKDVDFTVKYENNVNVGTASVVLTGIGNYKGTKKLNYTIKAKTINNKNCEIDFGESDIQYTGKEIDAVKQVTVTGTGLAHNKLVKGEDYDVTYENNKELGRAFVKIVGKGNFSGTVQSEFEIKQRKIDEKNNFKINIGKTKYEYEIDPIKPKVTVQNNDNECAEKTLVENKDYKVTYENNTGIGKASVKITGIGNYNGEVVKNFDIEQANVANCTISLDRDSYGYEGKEIIPKVTIKRGNHTLTQNTDYKLSYANNNAYGEGTVGITGLGNFTGTENKTFIIGPVQIDKIILKSSPSKLKYVEEENFDRTGMQVEIEYNNGAKKNIGNYEIKEGTNLKLNQKQVTISYTEDGVTKTASIPIEVREKLRVSYSAGSITENKYFEKINTQVTVKDVLQNITSNGKVEVYNQKGEKVSGSKYIGTGMKIVAKLEEQESQYIAVVTGDLNGDGQMNIVDLLRLSRYISNMDKNLEVEGKKASDLIGDGKYANITDLLKMSRVLANIENL